MKQPKFRYVWGIWALGFLMYSDTTWMEKSEGWWTLPLLFIASLIFTYLARKHIDQFKPKSRQDEIHGPDADNGPKE